MEELGAGELIINSIDRDGTGEGIDKNTIKKIANALTIPVVAAGGIGKVEHIHQTFNETGVNAVAAGSFFVLNGKKRSVLISYRK